jgi:hypothetical protein
MRSGSWKQSDREISADIILIMASMYKLTAQPRLESTDTGDGKPTLVRFSAKDGKGTTHVLDLPLAEHGIEGTIIVLLAGDNPERAIRVNQALKRGESVDLGLHPSDSLAELGFEGLDA